jgi:hypothetical protein
MLHLHFKQRELSTTDKQSHKVIYITEYNSYRSMEMNTLTYFARRTWDARGTRWHSG